MSDILIPAIAGERYVRSVFIVLIKAYAVNPSIGKSGRDVYPFRAAVFCNLNIAIVCSYEYIICICACDIYGRYCSEWYFVSVIAIGEVVAYESQCSARVVDLYNFSEPIYNVEDYFYRV